MSDKAEAHRKAAGNHDRAAASHDRAAAFWDEQRDQGRAELQRGLAQHERHGAEVERSWASLIDAGVPTKTMGAAELVLRYTRHGAREAARALGQLALTLERAAELAEGHADRYERAGRSDDATKERAAAARAHSAANDARAQADQWLELAGE